MTPMLRAFFATLDERLPADFVRVLDKEVSVMFAADLNAQGTPIKVQAYRSYPALGEYEAVDIGRDWGHNNKVWFRKRPRYNPALFSRIKYECLISYDEDYRPQFEVDYAAPMFGLALSAN